MSDSPPFRSDARLAFGTHLVGSVPLADAQQVLRWGSVGLSVPGCGGFRTVKQGHGRIGSSGSILC
jgi:hypothetical protein